MTLPFAPRTGRAGLSDRRGGRPPRPGFGPDADRQRVLVVEDEDVVGKLLQEVLRASFGCSVDLAVNGSDALRAIVETRYALVVSDIRMPEMNGMEFYLHLRELRPELAKRMVFVTGHAGDKAMEEEITRWAVPLVAKPFTPRRLVEVCAPFFDRSTAPADSA